MIPLSNEELLTIKEFRKELHRYPELGYEETRTTQKISDFMQSRGAEFHRFSNMTGGYILIDNNREKTIGFRADIDALPITERSGVDFASCCDGRMHACGHDMHTAIAAGVTATLLKNRKLLHCNVLVLFQPAEECNPSGGAKKVIQEGSLERCKVSEMYGLHVWPSLPVGQIALRPGTLMGSSDHFSIVVTGKKSHAAEPHRGIDALSIACEIYTALIHRLHRELSPFSGALISIGLLNTTGRYNIICDHAILEGTIRAADSDSRTHLHRRIPEIVRSIAESHQGIAEVKIDRGFDIVHNDSKLFDAFSSFAIARLGEGNVHLHIDPTLIGEDFSAYTAVIPALYFFLGCGSPYPLHSDHFIPDENSLETGINLVASYLLNRL